MSTKNITTQDIEKVYGPLNFGDLVKAHRLGERRNLAVDPLLQLRRVVAGKRQRATYAVLPKLQRFLGARWSCRIGSRIAQVPRNAVKPRLGRPADAAHDVALRVRNR